MLLSEAAIALFREHIAREGRLPVDDTARHIYRERVEAGLMSAGSTFRDGPESVYVLTQEGYRRKIELLRCVKEAI